MGWATGLAHRVPMGIKTNPRLDPLGWWLPMGLNNNGPGRPLAQWAVGFLGRTVGRGLFDDPYVDAFLIMFRSAQLIPLP